MISHNQSQKQRTPKRVRCTQKEDITMTEYIIETKNLTKLYHGSPAVNQINLQVPQCSIYGFLGPNGAGKSTTMKMLLGLTAQDKGSIQIFGREMNASNRIAILSQVGSLIESPSYYGNLTGYENLKISCTLRNLPHSEINEALHIVRLDNQKHKKTSHYSLGMKQRLGIANALLGKPKLLLLDEPTNGLDPSGIHEMRELIKSLPEKYGITLMVSSHLLAEIEQIADNVGIISSGKMIYQDSLYDLQSKNKRELLLRTSNDLLAYQLLIPKYEHAGLVHPIQQTKEGLLLPYEGDRSLGLHIRHLFENGIDLYRIEERRGNLEDIYLQMVQKEASL